MRVLTCLYFQHNPWLTLLAALMCALGSLITSKLVQRALAENGIARLHWCFLSAVTAGSAIWATHFIAMIGYEPGVPVTFAGALTIGSALVAVLGSGIGILIATSSNNRVATICGGGTLGLAVAAMHYLGMFAYRAQGIVHWLPGYVIASIAAAVGFAILAVGCLRRNPQGEPLLATLLLVLAIVTLHFTGMAAFSVTPIAGVSSVVDTDGLTTLAVAIALVALLILAAGTSTRLVELRTRVSSEEQLRHLALHDALTGLANRRHFNETLQAECARLDEQDTGFALLLVDLDRFKPVNDSLGHPAGDNVLRKVANRLRRAVREIDLVARIGGDEFAVIARGLCDAEAGKLLADRIVDLLSRPFIIDGSPAEIGASVGLVFAPESGNDADSLTRNADVALYTAKREGRGRTCLFEPRMTEAIKHRRALEADLRQACMREDFHVVYQPVRETGSNRFTGAEALVRWTSPERGDVSPADFIPIAEQMGLLPRIGGLVLRLACTEAASWPSELTVSVNLSPVQLLDPRLPQTISQALTESGLDPVRLELEITETALLGNDDLALSTLTQLRALGVRISIDDFGTGYSSLSYLHRFPIDRIKIDRSFVQRLPTDLSSVSIVRAIAQLGASLNMQITAEGIESSEQLLVISQYGCDHVQGFYICEPIRPSEVTRMFNADAGRRAA